MYKLSKNIQSNFPGRKKCYLYIKHYYIHPYIHRYSLTAQRNVCLRNSIWMAERESESAVSDVLEFNCKFGIF